MISEKSSGVANRVGGLRFGAVLERADEAEEHHAGDVHRDALHARRQPEAKQRPQDGPVRRPAHGPWEMNHDAVREDEPDPDERYDAARERRADRGAERAEFRDRSEPGIRIRLNTTFRIVIAIPSLSGSARRRPRALRPPA